MHASQTQSERLNLLMGLVEASRRATSVARLSDDELGKTAKSWDEIIDDIPTVELRDCYRESMQERTVRGAFLPQEILAAWRSKRKPQAQDIAANACGICDGMGWQLISIHCPTLNRETTPARPCGCSNAPQKQARSPLRPPEWEKRQSDGVWVSTIGGGLMCTCFACERSGRFSRASLSDECRDYDQPPCIR